jgi:hypothetical protein
MHNLHYERDGIPLDALEIRTEHLRNNARHVRGVIGAHREVIKYDHSSIGFDTPSNYFWFTVSLRNNFLERPGLYDTRVLLWQDDHNISQKWYRSRDGIKRTVLHDLYRSVYIATSDKGRAFPSMEAPVRVSLDHRRLTARTPTMSDLAA